MTYNDFFVNYIYTMIMQAYFVYIYIWERTSVTYHVLRCDIQRKL